MQVITIEDIDKILANRAQVAKDHAPKPSKGRPALLKIDTYNLDKELARIEEKANDSFC